MLRRLLDLGLFSASDNKFHAFTGESNLQALSHKKKHFLVFVIYRNVLTILNGVVSFDDEKVHITSGIAWNMIQLCNIAS